MKKAIIKLSLSGIIILSIYSCGGPVTEESKMGEMTTEKISKENNTQYQCSMKCEGEKVYSKEGSCPVCKMDLQKIDTTTEYH